VTIGALLASILVFGIGYAAARLFQGWLDARVLLPAGISGGVRNSIRTGIGYTGIVIAALAALSYAGFNLSSIAIIAGALSVGIGFGLQNLVNNFISGLILLVERPISVGDLVVVGGEEGCVRKISVRSTELETFDGANVLFPNSYFISEKVKNWTFRNKVRRVAIPIGVAYGSDPRQVQAVLLTVAGGNPEVLKTPEPVVTLDEFSPQALILLFIRLLVTSTKLGAFARSYRWQSLMPSPRPASRSPMGKRTSPFGKWIGCATSLGNLRRCLERDAREAAAGLVQSWRSKGFGVEGRRRA
jgi:potassium-dependent mechanosensitive channel